MKQIFTSIFIVSIFVGCGTASKKDKPVTNSTTPQLVLPQPYAPVAGTLPSPSQVISAPSNTNNASTTVKASGMNPAHGQPGHRCDIAVGAPLNNSTPAITNPSITNPANPNQTVTMSQPVYTSTGTNPPSLNLNPQQAAATATGMNPAHGQPGHRCDIAVGSPLNGKPTVTAPTTTSSTAPTFKIDQGPTKKVATAPGMNPPHGEPGHVCGTPVGSPLNGKKSTGNTTPTVAVADSSKKP